MSPTDSRPSNADDAKGTIDPAPSTQPTKTGGSEPETTQSQLATSDGAGIRGDYGDADQTNGLEGGDKQPTDAASDRADSNPTNAPQQ